MPAATNPTPMCTRWRPSLATSANEATIASTIPTVIGTSVSPAWIGEKRSPSWQNREMTRIRPANAPKNASATASPLV